MNDVQKPRLLLVDDDKVFRERLMISFLRRSYEVRAAEDAAQAAGIAGEFQPALAVVDLKMPGSSGLDLIPVLKAMLPDLRIVVLTGYGSIATALEALRQGAADYLTKPADADQIEASFRGETSAAKISAPSLDRVEWEHLQRVLSDCGHNISQASRVLGIERRTLQRKLAKYPPVR